MRFNIFRQFLTLTAAVAVVFCLFSVSAETAGTVVRLTFTGDCTIGGEDRLENKDYSFHGYIREHGYGWPFANFKDFFEEDDLTVVNFEGVLADDTRGRADKPINFRGPTDYVRILTGSSVEAAFLGNNHALDYGKRGLQSTIATLEDAGVAWFGDSEGISKPYIFEKEGVKIGFAGCYTTHWARFFDDLKLTFQALRDAECDAIVAVMHGGTEYAPRRWKDQEKLAAWFIREGADLVIGHHPHVVQGMDVIDDVSVVYSLGNFAFGGNKDVRSPYGLIARAEMRFGEDGEYLGHQVNLIPVGPSGLEDVNNYQPVFLSGEEALKAMALAQRDTPFELAPFVPGVGALQPFVPAAQPSGEQSP